jgi:adenylosuccinate synthase
MFSHENSILYPHVKNIIGNGVVVNLPGLFKELE